MKKNNYLSLIKLIGAMMVIVIHATAYINSFKTFWNYNFYRQILHLAVPTFFGITGYLTYEKINQSDSYPLNYAKRTLLLFLSLSLIHIVFYFILFTLRLSTANPLTSFSLSSFLSGTWSLVHLWYLWALVIAFFIIYYFKEKLGFIFGLSLFIYLMHKDGAISFTPYIAYGGFVKALVYIGVGRAARKAKISTPLNLLLILVSFVLFYYTSTIKWTKINELYMILFTFSVVTLANNVSIDNMNSGLVKLCSYSDNLYYYHMIGLKLLSLFYPILSKPRHRFPITIVVGILLGTSVTVVVSYILNPVNKKVIYFLNRSIFNENKNEQ